MRIIVLTMSDWKLGHEGRGVGLWAFGLSEKPSMVQRYRPFPSGGWELSGRHVALSWE